MVRYLEACENAEKMSEQLVPPNPNELFKTCRKRRSRVS